MTQLVTDERGQQHEFPDEATPQQILQALGRAPRDSAPSLGAKALDFAAQIGHGLGRGTAALAGIPGDLGQLVGTGTDWLLRQAGVDTSAPLPASPLLPTSGQTVKAAEDNIIGARPTPLTGASRFAGNVAAYVPGAMLPIGGATTPLRIAGNAVLGATSGAASEGARELGLGPVAQIGAGLLPGLLAGGAQSLVNKYGPTGLLKEATREVTPQQWNQAAQLQQAGQEIGVPLLGSEALAPKVGPGAIGQLASDIKATRRGAPILNPVFEQRPEQITSAVKRTVAPIGPNASADEVLNGVQSTVQKAIDEANRARTRVTSPLYKAANPVDIPESAVADIVSNIDSRIAEVGARTDIGKALTTLKGKLTTSSGLETNTGRLNTVYKELRDSLSMSPEMGGAARSHVGILSPIATSIDDALRANNPIYSHASDLYQRMSGPVTFLAGEPGGQAAWYRKVAEAPNNESLRRLMLDPENVSPQTVATLGTLFANKPEALSAWTRHYLENALDKTSKRLQSGENPALGANWSNLISGTPQTRGVLDAYLNQVDPSGGAARGMNRLLQVLDRTAKTPGTGSPTAQRLQMADELASGPLPTAASIGTAGIIGAMGAGAPAAAGGFMVATTAHNFIRKQALQMGSAKIARILTDPDSVGKLRALARKAPGSASAAASVMAILGGRAGQDKPNE